MAEVLLARHLDAGRVSASVSSAGLVGGGQHADPNAADVMAERGLDLSAHVSRLVDGAIVSQADLIVGMARAHLREVVAMDPDAWHRTFTLKELVRRGRRVGPRPGHLDVGTWLLRVGEDRPATDLLGESPDDDIDDPLGRSLQAFRETAAELDVFLRELVALVWPLA